MSGQSSYPYELETNGVTVRVKPEFLEEESSPRNGEFIWRYTVKIENGSGQAMKLLDRHWIITDAAGRQSEVRGDGVVGEQPRINSGDSFVYASGCPLYEPSGLMMGRYGMETDQGDRIEVEIPPFSLDSPHDQARRH